MDLAGSMAELRDFFANSPSEIVAAYLYGSAARGAMRPDSDIDIAVLTFEPPAPTLAGLPLDLETDLERRLGRRVQVVVLNTAPADLVHRVLRDGTLLLDRDPGRRIRFEVRARNEYFDLQPILARYRAAPSSRR